jgi:hypothetical protein
MAQQIGPRGRGNKRSSGPSGGRGNGVLATAGMGHATWKLIGVNLAEPDRIYAPKPGNAGGGKDPTFWCAFEVGEVKVIGDEPANTIERQDPSEIAVSCGEGAKSTAQKKYAFGLFLPVGLTVKPVGEKLWGGRRRSWHLHRPYELMEVTPWPKSMISAEA